MYSRNRSGRGVSNANDRRNEARQRPPSTVSFQEPLTWSNPPYSTADVNNAYHRLQQLMQQQSPSSTISSLSSSPPALNAFLGSSPASISSLLPMGNLPQTRAQLQILQYHQAAQYAQHIVQTLQAAQQQIYPHPAPSSSHRPHHHIHHHQQHHPPPQQQFPPAQHVHSHHAAHAAAAAHSASSASRRHPHSQRPFSRQHRLQLQQQLQQGLREARMMRGAAEEQELDEDDATTVYAQGQQTMHPKQWLTSKDFDALRVAHKPTYTINWDEWQQRVEHVELDPLDTNAMVLDYLLCEGDEDMAMEFSKESNTAIDSAQMESMRQCKMRARIRRRIENGNMLQSIALLREHDPDFIDKHEPIVLELQKQHLIELIHNDDIGDAYRFHQQHLLPKTRLNAHASNSNQKLMHRTDGSAESATPQEREQRRKLLLIELSEIMSLIICRGVKNMPKRQRNLLSLDRRKQLATTINELLLKQEKHRQFGANGQSLLYENMMRLNYYQDFLMNLGLKKEYEKGRISTTSTIMSYHEENINKVKTRHPEFGKRSKHRSASLSLDGIHNWVKLDNKYKIEVKNYLPFSFDTSKCQRFRLNKVEKCNEIHVCDKK